MSEKISESQILDALRRLDPSRWVEVLDFIGYLEVRVGLKSAAVSIRTARDLLLSELVGLWADRADIGDSLVFARQLRQQTERRPGSANAD